MRKGAYSNKYKAIEAERVDGLKAEKKHVISHHREKEKDLVRETNRRRRFIKEKKRSLANTEQKRRQSALEARRKRQVEATAKFQRQPIAKLKHEGTQSDDVPLLNDGVYNIRGHIVEIRNGIRVSQIDRQSNNQHMRKNSASEKTKNDYSMKSQYGSHAKNSIYSGKEYLLGHLSDLRNGTDKKTVQNQSPNPNQRKAGDNEACDEAYNINIPDKKDLSAPYDADETLSGNLTYDKGKSAPPLQNGPSTIDSLEVGTLHEVQSRSVELKRKSSLKRRQPPGSPTKEKRKVKFNTSIEFNDGLIWLLKDNEEKPRNGVIKNRVSTASTSGLGVGNTVVAGQNPTRTPKDSRNQSEDYSYPETVDLGIPSKKIMGREDGEKCDTLKDNSKGNFDKEHEIEKIHSGYLFDSLEVEHEANKNGSDIDVERDSLELSDNESDECHSSQDGCVQTDRRYVEQPSVERSATDINGNESREMLHKERGVGYIDISKRFRGDLGSTSLASAGVVSGDMNNEPEKNGSSYSLRPAGLHEHETHGDVYPRKTHESFNHHYPSYSQDYSQATSLQGTNTIASKPHNLCRHTTNEISQHHLISRSSAANFGHHIEAEITSKPNGTPSGYNSVSSKKPHCNEPNYDASSYYHCTSTAATGTGQSSSSQSRYLGGHEQKSKSSATVSSPARQMQGNYTAPTFYSTSNSSTLQDRYDNVYERQPVMADFHPRISKIDNTSKLLDNQSEVFRHHVETLQSRSYYPNDQHTIVSGESAILQKQSNNEEAFLLRNDPVPAKYSSVQNASGVLQVASDIPTTDSGASTRQHSGTSSARDTTTLIRQSKLAEAESDNEDELLKKVRKSMAELQFSSNWRPESAATKDQDHNVVSQDTLGEGIPRPSNRAKTMQAELTSDDDIIKAQSKLSENAEKKSNIPIRVKGTPIIDLSQQTRTVLAPHKAGIVPHPPKGPKGLFTRKVSRQSSHSQRNSPMRVIKPHANANKGIQNTKDLTSDGRLFSVEASPAATAHSGSKGMERGENRIYQQDADNAVLQGDIYLVENTTDNNLNKTPTDDEINELWYNVRNCLTAKPPAKASSDSVYIAPPWKQNRTWSGTTRGRSNTNRQLSLHSTSSTQGYPLRRYGSQDNLIRRENSLDNLVENSSSRGKSAVITQRTNRAKINTNFQAFTAKSSPIHKPYQSERTPDASRAKSNDMSESLASFIALEAMCQQESLSPHRTSAVLKASRNVYYQSQREKINAAQKLASTRRHEPSALSIEERKIMESLEKLNTRLREKESEIRKFEASSAWNQHVANANFQDTSREIASSASKVPKNQPRDLNGRHYTPYRY